MNSLVNQPLAPQAPQVALPRQWSIVYVGDTFPPRVELLSSLGADVFMPAKLNQGVDLSGMDFMQNGFLE